MLSFWARLILLSYFNVGNTLWITYKILNLITESDDKNGIKMSYLSGTYYWLYFSGTIIDLKLKVTELCGAYAPKGIMDKPQHISLRSY